MSYNCWYKCIRCKKRYSIYDVIYHCDECGGLLEVEHDMDALKNRSPEEWKDLFDLRLHTRDYPYGSGVWGKKEWVCPQIEDDRVISLFEGNTNLFNAHLLGNQIGIPDLWLKLCGNSHTGSFKDLGMTVLVSAVRQMRKDGKDIQAVACASTGDTSAALAAYAAAAGIPAVILLPKAKVSNAQLIQPIANGALVLSLDTDFDGCMAIVKRLTENPAIYLANSMNSLRIEGQKTIGIEIVQQLNWSVPDWIILPSGNLGNVSALGKGLLMMKKLGLIDRLPRIACAQSEKANPLYQSYLTGFTAFKPISAQKTLASAIQIGNPVSYERAVRILKDFNGVVEQVSEDELANAAAQADRSGLYCCPHTGVALGALIKLKDKCTIKSDERVVVVSTAHGLKFSDLKVSYHRLELTEVNAQYANPPLELEASYAAVCQAIEAYMPG
ncbi:MAG: threonine synthase [Anaerolineaceae bacterium]|nr:threonine synthase [Anaerolineaceae bacterium]MBN2678012.1 threonine synthase [Anaerolineaceae bacterium]